MTAVTTAPGTISGTTSGESFEDRFALREMLVRQVRYEADDVVSVQLVNADGSDVPAWTPGAHVDLVLPSGLVRQYSLCGVPADRSALTVAVLHDRNGRGGSKEIHDSVLVGRTIGVRGPRNHFKLTDADEYLLIAGGIGITPILAMARHLDAEGAAYRLVYGGRSRRTMAFLDELAALGSAVQVVPEDELGLPDLAAILDAASPGTHVYCCGPEGLLRSVEKLAEERDLPVHFERFGTTAPPAPATATRAAAGVATVSVGGTAPAGEPDPAGTPTAPGTDVFEVELRRSGMTVEVYPDRTILETVREHLPDVVSSCEEGFCGACETRVIEGIPDHRDQVLDEVERAANQTMMICVGRSCSKRLVLDL